MLIQHKLGHSDHLYYHEQTYLKQNSGIQGV